MFRAHRSVYVVIFIFPLIDEVGDIKRVVREADSEAEAEAEAEGSGPSGPGAPEAGASTDMSA